MYEYKYVNLLSDGVAAAKFQEHRVIIDQHAAQGWRYAGCIPTHISGSGVLCNLDLIFEREKEEFCHD